MKFASVKPAKLSDVIVDQIERLILSGELEPGERLPPERELARQFEVSRPPLREALMRLEAKNLVYTRRGGGTYVKDIAEASVTDPLSTLVRDHPESVLDILVFLHALEELAAYYAAQRATPEDVESIRARYAALVDPATATDIHLEAERDLAFHMAIAEASHNFALIHVMRSMLKLLQDSIHRNLEKLYLKDDNRRLIDDQHRRMLDAVLGRDPEAAREAAHHHLSFVGESMRGLDHKAGRRS